MAGSRRKHKRFRAKVRVGLPKRNPHVFKPAFTIPDALDDPSRRWDDEGSVITNYKAFGVVSNPNLLGVRNRTSHVVQLPSLQLPAAQVGAPVDEFDPIDSGSDLETDDLKSALGKRRRDGRHAPPQPLTKMQRVHVGRMVEKYRDDYQDLQTGKRIGLGCNKGKEVSKTLQVYQRRARPFTATSSSSADLPPTDLHLPIAIRKGTIKKFSYYHSGKQ